MAGKPKVVYILRARGVYWQDIYGVFDEQSEAVEHAKRLAEEADGYHVLVVTPFRVGFSEDADRIITGYGSGRYSETEIEIEGVQL